MFVNVRDFEGSVSYSREVTQVIQFIDYCIWISLFMLFHDIFRTLKMMISCVE